MQTRWANLASLGLVALTVGLTACAGWLDPNAISIDANVPHTGKPFSNEHASFQFAIVGDRTGGHRPGVFAGAMAQLNRLQPEFVLSVGDLIEGYTEDEVQLAAEWDEFDAMVEQLDMPFFYTVGNHDMGNPVMLETWRERHGHDYWAFVYRDVLFLSHIDGVR